jgi:hypothetical protein
MFLTSPYIDQAIALKPPFAGSMSVIGMLRQIGFYEEGPFEKNRSATPKAPEMITKSAIPSGIV